DLVFLENPEQLLIQRVRARKIGAERFFDDDAPPRAVTRAFSRAVPAVFPRRAFLRQAGLAEMTPDRREASRRCGQIKQAIAARGAFALDTREFLADLGIGRFIVGLALHIGDAAENVLEHLLIDRPAGELRQALRKILAKSLARRWTAGDAD